MSENKTTEKLTGIDIDEGAVFDYTPELGKDDPHPENELPDIERHKVIDVSTVEVKTIRIDVDVNTTFGWHTVPDGIERVTEGEDE